MQQLHITAFLALCCTFLLCAARGAEGIRMKNFEVPLHVTNGDSATLKCEFDLQGEALYSIKWYKGGREFFRYVPNEKPKKQRYEVKGVHVDLGASTGQKVVLTSVNLTTSGRYKCEVLGEAPSFDTLTEHAILTVVDIPDEKPIVSGAKEKYHPGDLVHVNCTSARSKPGAKLKWLINGRPASERYLIKYPYKMYPDGLEETTLGLHFRAGHEHFPRGSMSLKCSALIGVYYDQGDADEEASLSRSHFPALSLKIREHTYGSGVDTLSILSLSKIFILIIVAIILR